MRRIFMIFLGMLFLLSLKAQEKTFLYSHYTFDGLAINPAYAGSHEMLSFNLSHRNQWIGFDGAPVYNIFSAHTPFKNTPMGIGLLVTNESIGLRKYTGIYLNYAHRITLGRGKLALGLKGGIGTGKIDPVDLGDDIVFNQNARSYVLPNFGLGVYYYTGKFNAGLSVPLLFGYKSNANGDIIAYHDINKYAWYLTAGYHASLSPEWQLNPSALIEYDKAGGIIADAGLNLSYKNLLSAGVSYRIKQAVIMLFDVKVNNQLKVGLAYDYGLNDLNTYNRSSLEINLEYNLGYRVKASDPTKF